MGIGQKAKDAYDKYKKFKKAKEYYSAIKKTLDEDTRSEGLFKLGMKGLMGPIGFDDGYILEAMGSNTRVNFWLEFILAGPMLLAGPFVQLLGKTHAAETLANLKNVLETES